MEIFIVSMMDSDGDWNSFGAFDTLMKADDAISDMQAATGLPGHQFKLENFKLNEVEK